MNKTERKLDICDCDVIHNDVVEEVETQMHDEDLLMQVADLFKLFSDSTRVRILSALRVKELCVCDLACVLNMTKSAISHQLRSLRQSHLVQYRKVGKIVYYRLADDHVSAIIDCAIEHVMEE
ncbi:MAG: metalloregulator ArsR/SmtB family transcription factor [Lachnospiraceae bacterium]|nr:metalloregulator ArsR/SmtB family transcription factor [Lachnospiraceae bacterium]MDY5742117.1 metalloregulator ArsR/SmtB family transcription factor [Lachnospiraceae bacterium]